MWGSAGWKQNGFRSGYMPVHMRKWAGWSNAAERSSLLWRDLQREKSGIPAHLSEDVWLPHEMRRPAVHFKCGSSVRCPDRQDSGSSESLQKRDLPRSKRGSKNVFDIKHAPRSSFFLRGWLKKEWKCNEERASVANTNVSNLYFAQNRDNRGMTEKNSG